MQTYGIDHVSPDPTSPCRDVRTVHILTLAQLARIEERIIWFNDRACVKPPAGMIFGIDTANLDMVMVSAVPQTNLQIQVSAGSWSDEHHRPEGQVEPDQQLRNLYNSLRGHAGEWLDKRLPKDSPLADIVQSHNSRIAPLLLQHRYRLAQARASTQLPAQSLHCNQQDEGQGSGKSAVHPEGEKTQGHEGGHS